MKRRSFLIPSLFAAGLLSTKSSALVSPQDPSAMPEKGKSLFDVFRQTHRYTLVGHRSHSSHTSHSSHRSSSGGSYYSPSYSTPSPSYAAPLYTPPAEASKPSGSSGPSTGSATSTTAPSVGAPVDLNPPPKQAPAPLPGNSNKFAEIVRQVQTAMLAFGYYNGVIDGRVGPQMRDGLSKLQADYRLKVTGTITPETLDALKIVAR